VKPGVVALIRTLSFVDAVVSMKKVRLKDMNPVIAEGEKGSIHVFDPWPDEISAGIRVVKKDSNVPKRPHVHPEKQIIYVISGSGSITNGEYTIELEAGDYILLDSNEPHYVSTKNEDLTVFEVKYRV
jgi:mannose-6-phosphate isomerase-like protein (cupin superfamily)